MDEVHDIPTRDRVLDAIETMPNATSSAIARTVGVSSSYVRRIRLQGRGLKPAKAVRPRVGYQKILDATHEHPDASSTWIAQKLGLTSAAYVRWVWREFGLPERPAGYRPPLCASSPRGARRVENV